MSDTIPPGIGEALREGRLSQHCPAPGCPVIEAAGAYATCHNIPTGPADWFTQATGRPASGPQEAPESRQSGVSERPRAHSGGSTVPTLPAPPVAIGLWPTP